MNMKEDVPESDGVLVKNYLAGDEAAFDALYERYKKPLYSYLNRFLGSGTNADDVFQQTWLKAIAKLPGYQSREKFFSWLSMIAHNLAVDSFRREKTAGELPLEDDAAAAIEAPPQEAWREMDSTELGQAISEALSSLTPDLREVFLLRNEGLSFKEIAEIQKCPLNTALGRMNYALKNLRKLLDGWRKQR